MSPSKYAAVIVEAFDENRPHPSTQLWMLGLCPFGRVMQIMRLSCLFPKPIRNRQPSIPSKSLRRDLHPRGGLAAFVFVAVHHADYAADGILVESHRGDLLGATIFLDVGFEDGIEGLVGRQGVLVSLVGLELG